MSLDSPTNGEDKKAEALAAFNASLEKFDKGKEGSEDNSNETNETNEMIALALKREDGIGGTTKFTADFLNAIERLDSGLGGYQNFIKALSDIYEQRTGETQD